MSLPEEDVGLVEAAELLGVHYMTAYRYVRTGVLPAERHNGRWTVSTAAIDAFRAGSDASPTGTPARGRRAPHRERLKARMLASDAAGAWAVVERALASGTTPKDAIVGLIGPALREIGDGWERGEITVGEEHAASAVASRLVGRLGPMLSRRGRARGTVVLAGAPGEQHTLSMVMLSDLLRAEGWDILELGGDTPVDDLVRAVAGADRLVAVAISVGSRSSEPAAAKAAAAVHAAAPDVPVLIGGPGIADEAAARRLGADRWGRDAEAVSALLAEHAT